MTIPVELAFNGDYRAQELIQKYLDESRGSLFPYISEQKYNKYIKEAFRKAGLTRKVTTIDQRTRQNIQVPICDLALSHMARRTFIGNVYKSETVVTTLFVYDALFHAA